MFLLSCVPVSLEVRGDEALLLGLPMFDIGFRIPREGVLCPQCAGDPHATTSIPGQATLRNENA